MSRALVAALAVAVAIPAGAGPGSPPTADDAARAARGGPLDVTRSFYRALHAGDADGAARLATGDARASLRAFVRIARAHRELEVEVARRFGRDEAGRVGYGNRVQSEVKALLGAEEEIDGDDARVTSLDGRILATLHRTGSAWKVELDDAVATPGGAARLARTAAAAEAEQRRVTAGIRAGKYADAESAVRDFQQRVASATGPAGQEEGVAL